jgi:FkbM family methyltransferase
MKDLIYKAHKKSNISSLIHVGGHIGQEVNFYNSLNLDKVIYFEPVKEFADELKLKINKFSNFHLHQCALGNENSNKVIYIADKGEDDDSGSTSLLEPRKSDISFGKRIIEVKKYSSFDYSNIDIAVLDTQGYELEVLKGFENKLQTFKFIIVEFSNFEGYINQTIHKDLNKFLNLKNFSLLTQNKKVLKVFKNKNTGSYGDALYVNNKLINKKSILIGRIKFIILNSIIVDFLIKYTNVTFLKTRVKKLLQY